MSSSAGQVKVPLHLFGLEGRYATALYTAATKLKQLESVEKELSQVQASIKKSTKLREAITSPILKASVLEKTLKEIGIAAKLSSATTNLLVLLAENRRMKKIDGVINAFRKIMSAHRGEVICEVTTARDLDAGQRKQLEEVLRVSNQNFYNSQRNASNCIFFTDRVMCSHFLEIHQTKRDHLFERQS